jgi:hypothetical protein
MKHVSRIIDSDGSVLAEKKDGRQTVTNHDRGTDSPLIAQSCVSEAQMTQNEVEHNLPPLCVSEAVEARAELEHNLPPLCVSEEIKHDSGTLMTQPVVSSNPQYGNGVDEEPLSMPSVVS